MAPKRRHARKPFGRSEAQREKRSFLGGRDAIFRKLHELNTKTSAKLALVGIFQGKTFCYEENSQGILPSFGLQEDFSDRFGPDHVELVSERKDRPRSPSLQPNFFGPPSSTSATAETPIDTNRNKYKSRGQH